ncbi:hypothetical protein [Streptomyces mexicanus]|uniref:Uncharacterized protein n=1 Tax=Streptomyces mexicanus TaxID=178566 RepID=A0A7X1I6Q8_9ACTN|nr:hypothetical protein [Streptomyces mexicanus]MBC2869787.1 hypothetical protein [Streptomyces mexicanus]
MRNVVSSITSTDVAEEYAEQVEALIEKLRPERETTQVNEWGQTEYYVRLYTYEAPGSGETMWAVDYSDPAIRELEESASHEEAEARYVELVRDSAENLGIDGDGFQERFTTTDVDGVPGPLPELPTVDPDEVSGLLDEDGTPVLYLERTDGDELALRTGQADQVDKDHVVLTRAEVLESLDLADGETRITSDHAARALWDYGMQTSLIAYRLNDTVKAVADSLFPVPTA